MPAQGLFGISVAFFVAWGIVVAQYFWPLLRAQARVDALHPLLLLHSFRFVGLAFLVRCARIASRFRGAKPHMAISLRRCWPCLLAALRSAFAILSLPKSQIRA
jgi:hypothetical protein